MGFFGKFFRSDPIARAEKKLRLEHKQITKRIQKIDEDILRKAEAKAKQKTYKVICTIKTQSLAELEEDNDIPHGAAQKEARRHIITVILITALSGFLIYQFIF